MLTQIEKGIAFRALHHRKSAFIIPNPWDIGTARLLAHLGFEALATTSMGYALSVGQRDNSPDRGATMRHLADISTATGLPVSADLGNGFGDSPEIVAETILLAAASGVVGGSIEDATGQPGHPIYDLKHAKARISAAAEAVRSLPFAFTLTGRAENYLHGKPDLKDTITRLQAYQEAGADVLYAPGIIRKEDIAAVISSLDRPINVLMGLPRAEFSLDDLSALGVKRVSVGSALSRAALGAFLAAAKEMRERGTFTFADGAMTGTQISEMFGR